MRSKYLRSTYILTTAWPCPTTRFFPVPPGHWLASLLVQHASRECRYRFSGKPISTYMSLTLASLCGEWRLVSVNYNLVSGNYKARGASGGKYKAQIVIFRILASVNRFSRISWEAVELTGKPLKKIFLDFSEIGKSLKKIEFCVRKIGV